MPVTKNLGKLQKRKADTKLHPKGRKLKQLTTAELRHSKLNHVKSQRDESQERRLERHKFIKAICDNLKKPEYTIDDMRTMCIEFIDRNKPELDKLEEERRPGRPPSTRYQRLKLVYDMENKEFDDGFNIVDITNPVTVEHLSSWNGSWGGLNTLTMTRVLRQ